MTIVKADKRDLPAILTLQYLAYQSEAALCGNPRIPPLTQTLPEVEAEYERGVFLKAVDGDGEIVASVRAHAENGTLFIGKLMVRPDLQGRGLGTRLLEEIERVCPQARYELFTGTKSARNIQLYERAGYKRFKEEDKGNGLKLVYLEK